MIDYSKLDPIPHMYAMRLLLGGVEEGMMLKIKAATANEIWVDFRTGKHAEDKLSALAKKVGLTEIEPHHYSFK